MANTVLHYKGKPVTEMSKEELITAFEEAHKEIKHERERADRLFRDCMSLRFYD